MATYFNRVRFITGTIGAGDVTPGPAFTAAFFTPSEAGAVNGDTPDYLIVEGNDVELGHGVIAAGVLQRTVIVSKIAGVVGTAKMVLGGSADVAFVETAQELAATAAAIATNTANIATNTSNLAAHVGNTSNPHNVTKAQVGLGNVDNTSDANKPVSTAQQAALDLKAPIDSPILTGIPQAPTQSAANNSTRIATTAQVHAAIAADIVAPLALKADIASPTFTGDPKVPTATAGDNDTSAASTAFVTAAIAANAGGGWRNLLYNSQGLVTQRGTSGPYADDTYGLTDRWYVLTQSNPVNLTNILNFNGENCQLRSNQANASAQRYGVAQILEYNDTLPLRGKQLTLSGKGYLQGGTALRYAVCEWVGTANAVVSDIVNNWASGTYTAGNFFLASNLNVLGVGSAAVPLVGSIAPLTVTVGSTANNLIVFFWTEATAAFDTDLMIAPQLERGAVPSAREYRPYAEELAMCQRYFQALNAAGNSHFAAGMCYSSVLGLLFRSFAVEMRAAPTMAISAVADFQVIAGGASPTVTAMVMNSVTPRDVIFEASVASGLTTGQGALLRTPTGNAVVKFDAEL